MRSTYRALYRGLALLLVLGTLFLTGCSRGDSKDPTAPQATTAPTTPSTPTEPTQAPESTAHQKLHDYLVTKGSLTTKEATYTFTMRAQGENILWEYQNDSTTITVTLADGAAMHPVDISFAIYTANADVDPATYSSVEHALSNFRCTTPSIADSLKSMATTAVWSCFVQAAKLMAPAGVDLVSLGFVNYYG